MTLIKFTAGLNTCLFLYCISAELWPSYPLKDNREVKRYQRRQSLCAEMILDARCVTRMWINNSYGRKNKEYWKHWSWKHKSQSSFTDFVSSFLRSAHLNFFGLKLQVNFFTWHQVIHSCLPDKTSEAGKTELTLQAAAMFAEQKLK